MRDVMARDLAVYRLTPTLDDPRYKGFASVGDVTFRAGEPLSSNFLPERIDSRDWQPPRLAPVWRPVRVAGRVRAFNDYPCVNLIIPAFSRRAVDELRDLLEPNGELLPLASDLGEYYAFNVTKVADVLDVERSQIRWNTKPVLASRVERFEFIRDRLRDLSIFQLPELAGQTFVMDLFASRVHDRGLKGFNFDKVWPLPPGVSWWDLSREKRRSARGAGLPRGQTVKGNSVVIRLRLEGGRRGSGPERRRIDRLLDDLDQMLVDPASEAPPIGTLEGHDFGVTGECRIFLSCPDADVLAEKLRPWLRRLDWPSGFEAVKRYGALTDASAREEVV